VTVVVAEAGRVAVDDLPSPMKDTPAKAIADQEINLDVAIIDKRLDYDLFLLLTLGNYKRSQLVCTHTHILGRVG
jgi:hypothetical protein